LVTGSGLAGARCAGGEETMTPVLTGAAVILAVLAALFNNAGLAALAIIFAFAGI